jgi:hypothetical protein
MSPSDIDLGGAAQALANHGTTIPGLSGGAPSGDELGSRTEGIAEAESHGLSGCSGGPRNQDYCPAHRVCNDRSHLSGSGVTTKRESDANGRAVRSRADQPPERYAGGHRSRAKSARSFVESTL